MISSPKVFRAVLTPDQVGEALGHYVLFQRGAPPEGHAKTECMFVIDEKSPALPVIQVLVEVTVTEGQA